jgi:hypothetical protein
MENDDNELWNDHRQFRKISEYVDAWKVEKLAGTMNISAILNLFSMNIPKGQVALGQQY